MGSSVKINNRVDMSGKKVSAAGPTEPQNKKIAAVGPPAAKYRKKKPPR